MRAVLCEKRFVDQAPREVFATLLDEGRYLCSPRTMYRILKDSGAVRERRDQLRHPAYKKPELLATKPNELWSWDIAKLKGPAKWSYFQLYVLLDVFSRYVVGWTIAPRESGAIAKQLIEETCARCGASSLISAATGESMAQEMSQPQNFCVIAATCAWKRL